MASKRDGYSNDKDIHLCSVYMAISQDPITGVYQSSNTFWSRIEDTYNNEKNESWMCRSFRSLQSRIQTIEKAVRKLNAYIRQVENQRINGSSDQDTMKKARILFGQDKNSSNKGFKFDHIWSMMKDFPKFQDDVTPRQASRKHSVNYLSSESDNLTLNSPTQESPGLSSFNLNLDEDVVGATSSERPIGVKKAKSKRKIDDQDSALLKTMQESHRNLVEMFAKNREERLRQMDVQKEKLEMQKEKMQMRKEDMARRKLREDNETLRCDLNTISDPTIRAVIQADQAQIVQERAEKLQQPQPSSTSNTFGALLSDIGGFGAEFPDYQE